MIKINIDQQNKYKELTSRSIDEETVDALLELYFNGSVKDSDLETKEAAIKKCLKHCH